MYAIRSYYEGYFLECLKANSKTAFGIDLSEHQIQVCHEKGLDNTACISLNEVKEKYDCATAIFDVINYINKDDLKQFFEDCYNLLNKDGYFIFDVNTLFGFEDIAQGCITIDFRITSYNVCYTKLLRIKKIKELIDINLTAPIILSSLLLRSLKKTKGHICATDC